MESREVYGFVVLRRGPPFPEDFHFSLSAVELSRKAMYLGRQRKKQGKKSPIAINSHEVSKLGEHSTTKEIAKPTNDMFQDYAIKRFCTDIIIVAAHELEIEDETDLKNKQTTAKQNDEIDFLADRGDGFLPAKDTIPVACIREHGIPDQNLQSQYYTRPNSGANIQEVARTLCQEAISKAVYIVAKENLELVQKADHDNIATASSCNKNEELLLKVDPSVDATPRPTEALDKPGERRDKKISKAELKEQRKHQRFQEKKAIAYIKMVNAKYKERNDTINKLLKDQAKDEKKRKEEEKKLQKRTLKVEKKEQKKKEKEAKEEMVKKAKLEKRRTNNTQDEQTTGSVNRLSFTDRILGIFGCFFH